MQIAAAIDNFHMLPPAGVLRLVFDTAALRLKLTVHEQFQQLADH